MSRKETKDNAIRLRKEGHSYSYISKKLDVPNGTLSYWLSDIPYKPNEETKKRIKSSVEKMIAVKRGQRDKSLEKAKKEALQDIGKLNKRDLFMLGLGLYIGEGTKSHGITRVINSNPKVINLAIRWFEEVCGLEKDNFSITLHIYPDNNKDECLKFWSKYTNIAVSQFGKTQIDIRKKKKSKRGKLPYGTAHLTVRGNGKKEFGVFLSRKIGEWTNLVLDNK